MEHKKCFDVVLDRVKALLHVDIRSRTRDYDAPRGKDQEHDRCVLWPGSHRASVICTDKCAEGRASRACDL